MFCSKCGKQAEGQFCWNCGSELYSPTPVPERPLSPFSLFSATSTFTAYDGYLQDDARHQMMRFVPADGGYVYNFRYRDIVDVELIRDDVSVYQTNTGSMLTRAALGSFVGLGVAGAVTAKKSEQRKIKELYLRVTLKNTAYPLIKIYFLHGTTFSLVEDAVLTDIESALATMRNAQMAETIETAYEQPLPKAVPAAEKKSNEKWRCEECDYSNNGSTTVCGNCGCPRPSEKVKGLSYTAIKNDSVSGDWYCTRCDYHNKSSAKTCASCGALRTEDKPKDSPKKSFFNFLKK